MIDLWKTKHTLTTIYHNNQAIDINHVRENKENLKKIYFCTNVFVLYIEASWK